MVKILSVFLVFVIYCTSAASDIDNALKDDYNDFNKNIYRKYAKMDSQLKEIAEQGFRKLLPYLVEASEHVNISARCSRNLFDLITGFRKLTGWSFNFLDSMGKLQSGMQTGNLQMFGEYDECIETNAMKKNKINFQGQYCQVGCRPLLPKLKRIPAMTGRIQGLVNATRNSSDVMKLIVSRAQIFYTGEIKFGICVPSGCSKEDVSQIAKYSVGEYINTTVNYCLKKGDIYFWTVRRIVTVSIFVLLGAVVFISTCLDNFLESWKNDKLGVASRILQCFSLTRNFPKLINTEVSQKSVTCFHGIRVLTIFWIVLGHEYFLHAIALTANHGTNYEKLLTSFFSQIVLNGFLSVEMVFFMSGFVNSYTRILIKQEGRSRPGVLKIIAHRLWRIYPAYIASFLLMYLLTKPQAYHYGVLEEVTDNCDLYWWRNMLFINNFFHPLKMCMAQSWFLCVDMQLFLVSLFTVPVLLRKPKMGIILHIIIIIIVNLCSMSWWLVDHVAPSTLDATRLDRSEATKSFRISAHTPVHVGPYCIGILLGYVIATNKQIKLSKVYQLFAWLAASLLFVSMLFMTLRWNSGTPYTYLESSLYGAWSRTLLTLGFSWLVYCCATGRAGLINYVLSLKLWIPLSRMTYMIFLVSPLIQTHYGSHLSFPADFSDMIIIWTYFADLTISILMSLALVLLVESPVIAMEKILFRRNEDSNKKSFEMRKESAFNEVKENGFSENGRFTTLHL